MVKPKRVIDVDVYEEDNNDERDLETRGDRDHDNIDNHRRENRYNRQDRQERQEIQDRQNRQSREERRRRSEDAGLEVNYGDEDNNRERQHRRDRRNVRDSQHSRERDRDRRDRQHSSRREENPNNSFGGFDLSNMDFGQIAGMLQNVDLSQIASLFGGAGNKPVNKTGEKAAGDQGLLDSLGTLVGSGAGQGLLGGLGALAASGGGQGLLDSLGSLLGNGGIQGLLGGLGDTTGTTESNPTNQRQAVQGYTPALRGERGVDILWALRPMVSVERAALIDMVVQLYTIGKVLKGALNK